VRSDLHVEIELTGGGDLTVELTSKVDAMYGESIRETARGVLDSAGVRHARVVIDDKGALPFTIAARVEAAARRAGARVDGDPRPEASVSRSGPTLRDRLRRQPKFMVNAGLHGPDAVILDLEDSVHPDDKDSARLLVRNALRCIDFRGAERMVRINQLPLGIEDLKAIVPEGPDLILIPKTERPDQVREVADRIKGIRAQDGDGYAIWLMPILESARGIEHAYEIASADESVVALTIGLEDYTADLGVQKTAEGAESLYARSRLVNAARAARIQPIDSVYGDVADMEGLRDWALRSRALGFEGMGCVHPRQIEVVHAAFAPTADELDRALRIVEAFREADARGLGVVSLGSKMIDPPVVERARKLVERAQRAGLVPARSEPGADG
jgi:citrate lyase subunit beta/citryl-CoA lyase